MEGIIRPFQNTDNTPRPLVGGVAQQVSPNVVLTFGKNGGGKTGNISISASTTSYITKVQKELPAKDGDGNTRSKENARNTHKMVIYETGDVGASPGGSGAMPTGGPPPRFSSWVEVTRSDDLTLETGQGPSYQKTQFAYKWPDTSDDTETVVGPGRKRSLKTLKNPDGAATIDLYVLDQITVETGRGQSYQKTVHSVDNTNKNEKRKTTSKSIIGHDKNSRISFELIDSLIDETGRGQSYQKTKYQYTWKPPLADGAVEDNSSNS